MTRFAAVLALLALVGLAAPPARAGDRELEILLVNMTPEPSDAARACSARIRRAVRADYTHLSVMGESRLRAALGEPSGPFMEWETGPFEALKRREGTWLDTVALYDCRPEARRLEALVVSPSGVAKLRLREVAVDDATIDWFAARLLRHGWVGFSP